MFRKFFKSVANAIRTYVSKNGIVRSVCNAIEGAILGSGIVVFITTTFKRWRTKRKFNKLLKQQGINEIEPHQNNNTKVNDENRYRLTTDDIYNNVDLVKKNKKIMEEIDKLYTEDNRDMVRMIEKYEPNLFEGLNLDQKYEYVRDHNFTVLELMKRYGLDKETQIKKAREEALKEQDTEIDDTDLQKLWDEAEGKKVGISSKVPGGFKHRTKKKPGTVTICNPMAYAAMEMTYGCENFNYANPSSESELRRLRRMKFDDAVAITGSWMSWNYLYDKKVWEHWMKKSKGDPVQIWRYMMILFLDDDNAFNTIKKELEKKGRDMESEMRGNRPSKRPKISNFKESEILEKMEDALERLDELKMDQKRNTPIGVDDDDEDDNEELSADDEEENDFSKIMEGSEDILDQLDALRSGNITGNETETEYPKQMSKNQETATPEIYHTVIDANSDEVVTHQTRTPVKMIDPDAIKQEAEDENDPELIKISPQIYTIDLRAQKILKLFNERYAEDPKFARLTIMNMLEDENGKNYAIFETSPTMQKNRADDRERGLPWKAVPCDYRGKPNHREFLNAYQEKMNKYGVMTWKQMVDDRTKYYRDKFEYDTVEKILEILPDSELNHETQVAFIAMLLNADHNYSIEIESSRCNNLCEEAKKIAYDVPVVDLSGKF